MAKRVILQNAGTTISISLHRRSVIYTCVTEAAPAAAVMKVCRDQSRNELPETIVTLMKRTR